MSPSDSWTIVAEGNRFKYRGHCTRCYAHCSRCAAPCYPTAIGIASEEEAQKRANEQNKGTDPSSTLFVHVIRHDDIDRFNRGEI